MNGIAEQRARLRAELPPWWQRRPFTIAASCCVLLAAGLIATAEYILHNAEPILRTRIVETLSARFQSPVELDGLGISLFKGIEVEGTGLRIPAESFGAAAGPPLLAVRRFAFHTTLMGLLRQPTHVRVVEVDGMELHIPPADKRARLFAGWKDPPEAGPESRTPTPKIALLVAELRCTGVRVVLDPGKPAGDEARAMHAAKAPLVLDIATLTLRHITAHQPMLYDAQLTNPKPVGQLHITGDFGPWAGPIPGGGPGDTPLDGDYNFDHADLSTIKGIGGTLSSTGHFSGVLNRIQVDGETDTPDFRLDISDHPVPLQTRFRAIVDGTSGDTYLQPVQARLAGSDFTTSGKIVKLAGQGHDIELAVNVPHGRMQDFLRLAVKTDPPLMNGTLALQAMLHIPPGPARVPEKMSMAGVFALSSVGFNNPRLQNQIDGLSARASGHPEQANTLSPDHRDETHSGIGAHFTLAHGQVDVPDMRFTMPGVLVLMNGAYSMDGRLFEFRGHLRTQATASEMVGGWKGLLLKPLDRFLEKNGAGVELPVEISGTEGEVHLGLAVHGADATPGQMLADVREKRQRTAELDSARRENALADQEDAAAAHAPTLEAAQRAHAAAVRHRADAQRLATDAQAHR